MASTAVVQAAWLAKIASHADLIAYTENIYFYDILEQSQKQKEKYYYKQEINFITILVSRAVRLEIANCETHIFEVIVNHYREHDRDGENQASIKACMETIERLVRTELGKTWDGTVDGYSLDETPSRLDPVIIDDKECWSTQRIFTAQDFEAN